MASQKVPKASNILCMDYDVAIRLKNIESEK